MNALAITAVGAMTAVGEDAPATVGSIYTEAEAFRRLPVAGAQPLAGAVTPIPAEVKGIDRLVALGTYAAREATQAVAPGTEIGLVVCASPDSLDDEDDAQESLLSRIGADAGLSVDTRTRRVFLGSSTTTCEALAFARKALYSRDLSAVCVLGVDTLSTQPRLGKLVRERSSQGERFVPGEAAAAILLRRQNGEQHGSESLALLAGVGMSAPDANLKLSKPAKGSLTAIEQAVSSAETRAPVAALIHDLPPTQAGDEELAWLQGSAFSATPGLFVLAPATSTGETGAASPILLIATLAFMMEKKEIGGPGLCLFASMDAPRGAALLVPPKPATK